MTTLNKVRKELDNVRRAVNYSEEEVKREEDARARALEDCEVVKKPLEILSRYNEQGLSGDRMTEEEREACVEASRLYWKTRNKLYPPKPRSVLHY